MTVHCSSETKFPHSRAGTLWKRNITKAYESKLSTHSKHFVFAMYLENCILKIWYKVQTERFETNIKTSEVLHESVTKTKATNKPKTNGATLCIREWGSKPAWGKRPFRKSSIFFMPFASQMSSHFLISPYESELSTAFLKNNRPLSYLNWSSYKERRVDALALRADERRDKLR